MASVEAAAAKGTVNWRIAAMSAAARNRRCEGSEATVAASINWGNKGRSAKALASSRPDLGVGRLHRGNCGGSGGPAAAVCVAAVGSGNRAGMGG